MEMSLATAVRLGRRARGHGALARWARSRLLRAGDRDEYVAIYQVWDLWLEAPDGELWAALTRWHQPRVADGLTHVALGLGAAAADVVAAARRAGHPIAAIARARVLAGHQDLVDAVCEAATTDEVLAGFCREHDLVPADQHRAAVYFLLTGQDEQYRLVDPDHSLLAVAYQGAGEDERARVRARVAGDPDLVRVLADTVRRGGLARLGEQEADYLVDTFAGRQDWAGLWGLVRELPVVDAVAAMWRFGGWRPAGPDTVLFDALAAADPAELARSHGAVAKRPPVHLPVRGATEVSISPDGRRIVVGSSVAVDVFTLDGDAPPEHVAHQATPHRCEVLALDDAAVVNYWTRPDFTVTGATPGFHRVTRAAAFDWTADGFAALVYDQEKNARTLRLLSGSGPDVAQYERRDLDLRTELGLSTKVAYGMRTIAVDPGSGLIAFAGMGLFLARITDAGLRPMVYTPFTSGLNPVLAFSGPDRLVGMDDERTLRVWRPAGEALELVAERKIAGASPADLPGAGVIAMQDTSHVTAGRRQLRYVDGTTLADVPLRDRFNLPADTYGVFASPDGTRLGVCYWDGVEVVEVGFTELAHRPLAATTPADLYDVRARLAREPADSTARPFLELLRTCLEHRFGTDVAIGDGAPTVARPDDIALGGPA
jgi:hypothetical protein